MELRDYIVQYQKGRMETFDEIFLRSKDVFYRYACMVAGKNETLIRDTIQDMYIQIMQSLDRLDNPNQFIPWGKTILRNKIYAFYRKNGNELTVSRDEDEEGAVLFDRLKDQDAARMPGKELDREAVRELIRDAVRELPDKQRVIACLYYMDDMPVSAVAAYLQISKEAVKSCLYNAGEAVRVRISEYVRKNGIPVNAATLPFALMHTSLTRLPEDFRMSDAVSHAVSEGCKSALGIKTETAAGAAENTFPARESAQETVRRLMQEAPSVSSAPEHVEAGRSARSRAAEKDKPAEMTGVYGDAESVGKSRGSRAMKIIAVAVVLMLAAGGGFLFHMYSNSKAHPAKSGTISAGKHSAIKKDTDTPEPEEQNTRQTESQPSQSTQSDSASSDQQDVMQQYDSVIGDILSHEEKLENAYKQKRTDGDDSQSTSMLKLEQSYLERDFDHDGTPDLFVIDTKNYDSDRTATTNIILKSPSGVQVIKDTHIAYFNDIGERISLTSGNKTVRIAYFGEGTNDLEYYGGKEYQYQLSPYDHKTMIYVKTSGTDSGSSSAIKEKYADASYAHRVCSNWPGDNEASGLKSYKTCDDLRTLLRDAGINC